MEDQFNISSLVEPADAQCWRPPVLSLGSVRERRRGSELTHGLQQTRIGFRALGGYADKVG